MFRSLSLIAAVSLSLTPSIWALSGTRGTPLGGMGTGYVRFDATTGDFTASGKTPPAAADGWNGADYTRKPSSSGFHFFANGESVTKAKTTDEDAKCPAYFADFGKTGGVKFKLTAFGPYLPGDDPENFKLATSPMAFFEILAVNENSEAVDVAAAMEFANGNLLGGAATGEATNDNKAVSFSGSPENAYLAVDCDGSSPKFSAGAIGSFKTEGTLANGSGNLVAAKCNVAAGQSVRFKFVLAWWRKYESSNTSRYSNWDGKENYWYHNNYENSEKVAKFGIEKFDAVKNGITLLVNRTMASNFPEWYKDRLLNNTYPLIHNSQVSKDGRLAFWEGLYGIIGTIDQGQHAALFYTFNWPEVQWKELNYWRSTTRQGTNVGQIHHDFNIGIDNFHSNSQRAAARFMCPYNDHDNKDYWWFPNTESWADLNVMFIFKAYELMMATGNKDSVIAYFPAVKTTAERVLKQAAESGENSRLPLKNHSTYDESNDGGKTFNLSPEYNGGISLACYQAVAEMAKFIGEDDIADEYMEYFEEGKTQYYNLYAKDISSNNYAKGRDCSEGDVAGYSWANYLCLKPVMDSGFIAAANAKLWSYYSNRTESNVDALRAKLGKWGFYTCDHWGGTEIATGNPDRALVIHKWDWEYYYQNSPAMIYWQTLRKESGHNKSQYASYMTGPTVWRSYFQMIGYMIDNANKRLWIRPRIPSDMNGKIENALLLNPKCFGTLNYDENKVETRTQSMSISFDKPVSIKEFVLKNNTGIDEPGVAILNSGSKVTIQKVKAEGSGYEKNIRVTLADQIEIGPEGVKIEVFAGSVGAKNIHAVYPVYSLGLQTAYLRAGNNVRFTVNHPGSVAMELLSLNGAKIGTIMQKNLSTGNHSFVWNGKTLEGKGVASTMALLRLSNDGKSVTRAVMIVK